MIFQMAKLHIKGIRSKIELVFFNDAMDRSKIQIYVDDMRVRYIQYHKLNENNRICWHFAKTIT